LVIHELFHGLGFGSSGWLDTFDPNGKRRSVIQQLKVTDADGSEDVIYHFVKGTRTYEAAKLYFGCEDEEREVTEGTPHQLGRPGLGMPLAGGTFP
ncbi:Leishmanolysin-like, partial [Durusdinium trenchii]